MRHFTWGIRLLAVAVGLAASTGAGAERRSAEDASLDIVVRAPSGKAIDLQTHRWKHRVLVAFAASEDDKALQAFQKSWIGRAAEVADRGLLLITVLKNGASAVDGMVLAPGEAAKIRRSLQVSAEATQFLLFGKDGTEKLRASELELDYLFGLIDAMPMRQREMRERN
ncbi:MAG: DUF4174 domain-containing protein [Planctomycetota bacterium]